MLRPLEGGGTVSEVFAAFLKLGLTSFGGSIAHLGYFRFQLDRYTYFFQYPLRLQLRP